MNLLHSFPDSFKESIIDFPATFKMQKAAGDIPNVAIEFELEIDGLTDVLWCIEKLSRFSISASQIKSLWFVALIFTINRELPPLLHLPFCEPLLQL